MNIYVAGKCSGAYRTGSVLKFLVSSNKYGVYIDKFNAANIKKNVFVRKINSVIRRIIKIFNFIVCDVVYLSIMSHDDKIIKWCQVFHKPIITEFYLSLYDTFVRDKGVIAENSHKSRDLINKDIFALTHSDKIIFLALADIDYYENLLGIDLKRFNNTVIPLVSPIKPIAKMKYFNDDRSYVQLCWTGTYIPLQGLDKVIKAMEILKEKSDIPIKLFIWGRESKESKEYSDLVRKLKLDDVIMIHNEWGDLEAWETHIVENCDISIGIFGDTDKAKYVVANKVVDGIAFKTPVITAHSTGIDEFFDGENDIFITDNSSENIAKKIMEIIKLPKEELTRRIENAYKIYEENFSEKAFENKFKKVITEMEDLISSEKRS